MFSTKLACVHPLPTLKKNGKRVSPRFFLEGEDDGCDIGYTKLALK